jgi:flavin reductase (DIM6/NTAB) family NADH-FMN oxidoreductase RutF
MTLNAIAAIDFLARPIHLWDVQSLVLTCGDFERQHFNAMTVGWGGIGYMWRRPFIQVVVRPVRYTYEFIEKYDTFTLCAFPGQYQAAVQLLGTKSGRDGDKITEAGLHPAASTRIAAPGFAEASLILECRKIYWDDVDPEHFLDPEIDKHYPRKDYHRIYYGEILAIFSEQNSEAMIPGP